MLGIDCYAGDLGEPEEQTEECRCDEFIAMQAYCTWVPVAENLPDEGVLCLVVTEVKTHGFNYAAHRAGYAGRWRFIDRDDALFEPTHWMRLPALYTERIDP